tara:strand:+ start:12587 stop:15790 length:3204 start_codon:yes stop_codon:yes gene_type:complete
MVQIQVFFDNQEVELFKDESIVLTQSIQDIRDIQKVFLPFTQTFNVPASKSNNKLFKHFYNFNIEGFDARTKTDAELYLNYKLFKKGKIKLEGVQLKNNEPYTYKLTFFGNTVNLKDLVGEDKLTGLDNLRNYKFDYNTTNLQTLMTSGLDIIGPAGNIPDALIVPLITHTARLIFDSNSAVTNTDTIKNINTSAGTSTSYGVPLSELKPAIRIYAIIKAIELQYNLTFSTDFFNTTNLPFFNLYMWMHNKEGALFQDQQAQAQFSSFNIVQEEDDAGLFTGIGNSSFETKIDEILQTDSFSRLNINQIQRLLVVEVVPSGSAVYNLVIKRDGEEFRRFEGLTGTTSNGQSTTVKIKDGIEIEDGTYTFFVECETSSTYTCNIITSVNSTRLFGKKREIQFTGSASVTSDAEVKANELLPEIRVIDFLTSIFKMFNLTAFQDDDGIIQVKTLDSFYASSTTVHDITKYIDKSEIVTDSILPFKEVDFRYEGTDTFLANNHRQLGAHEWGALYFKENKDHDGQVYNINIPFEHFKYEHLFVSNNNVVSSTDSNVQYGFSVDENQSAYLGKPLLFYAVNSSANIRAINLANTSGVTVNTPFIPLNCIETGSTALAGKQSINFNAEFDEFSRQVNNKSLFETYYKNYITDAFDPRKRITSLKAYLPMSIIYNLDLADRFIYNNNEYRINKITTNFETEQSQLELTNIFEAPLFRNVRVVQNNCELTADTTNISADTLDIKADAGCENQFTLPSIKTAIPQDVVNDPVSVFLDTDLPVTAPTIAELQIPVATNNTVFFAHQITKAGKVGDKDRVDEYGFLYATSNTNLNSTDDIDTLKTLSGITTVPFIPTLAIVELLGTNSIPIESIYKKEGLSHPATFYYRFYARTNTKQTNTKADAISTAQLITTNASTPNQYNNGNGEAMIGGINGATGFLTLLPNPLNLRAKNFSDFGYENQNGFIMGNAHTPMSGSTAQQIIKWLASVSSVDVDTYYDITHTFKAINAQGADAASTFAMTNKTGAAAKYVLYLGIYPLVFIKGGTTSGTLTSSGTFSMGPGPGFGSSDGDLISTS